MDIKILSPEEVQFKERDIQTAFEKDLSKLEEGLEFVASEVVIGSGRIDTLAFDTNTGRPVIIEYKGSGGFDTEALIQLMDYLSWFARDENRLAMLEKVIKQHKPGIIDFDPSILLICVVADIRDRIRNAMYALNAEVKVFSYVVAKDTGNNVIIVPRLEVDNSDVEQVMRSAIPESELIKKHPHLQEIFIRLKAQLEKDGVIGYTTSGSFRFKKERVFAKARFRKKYIQLELRVGKGAVKDDEFKYWKQGESSWGYTYIYPEKELSPKLIDWINKARLYVAQMAADEENEIE
jgi:hypothetical protein